MYTMKKEIKEVAPLIIILKIRARTEKRTYLKKKENLVGRGRFELPTSCLSSMRSKPTELTTLRKNTNVIKIYFQVKINYPAALLSNRATSFL